MPNTYLKYIFFRYKFKLFSPSRYLWVGNFSNARIILLSLTCSSRNRSKLFQETNKIKFSLTLTLSSAHTLAHQFLIILLVFSTSWVNRMFSHPWCSSQCRCFVYFFVWSAPNMNGPFEPNADLSVYKLNHSTENKMPFVHFSFGFLLLFHTFRHIQGEHFFSLG